MPQLELVDELTLKILSFLPVYDLLHRTTTARPFLRLAYYDKQAFWDHFKNLNLQPLLEGNLWLHLLNDTDTAYSSFFQDNFKVEWGLNELSNIHQAVKDFLLQRKEDETDFGYSLRKEYVDSFNIKALLVSAEKLKAAARTLANKLAPLMMDLRNAHHFAKADIIDLDRYPEYVYQNKVLHNIKIKLAKALTQSEFELLEHLLIEAANVETQLSELWFFHTNIPPHNTAEVVPLIHIQQTTRHLSNKAILVNESINGDSSLQLSILLQPSQQYIQEGVVHLFDGELTLPNVITPDRNHKDLLAFFKFIAKCLSSADWVTYVKITKDKYEIARILESLPYAIDLTNQDIQAIISCPEDEPTSTPHFINTLLKNKHLTGKLDKKTLKLLIDTLGPANISKKALDNIAYLLDAQTYASLYLAVYGPEQDIEDAYSKAMAEFFRDRDEKRILQAAACSKQNESLSLINPLPIEQENLTLPKGLRLINFLVRLPGKKWFNYLAIIVTILAFASSAAMIILGSYGLLTVSLALALSLGIIHLTLAVAFGSIYALKCFSTPIKNYYINKGWQEYSNKAAENNLPNQAQSGSTPEAAVPSDLIPVDTAAIFEAEPIVNEEALSASLDQIKIFESEPILEEIVPTLPSSDPVESTSKPSEIDCGRYPLTIEPSTAAYVEIFAKSAVGNAKQNAQSVPTEQQTVSV